MMRIGICDDEPVFLEIMQKELEAYYRSLDLEVRAFSDGKELEEAVKKEPFSYTCIFLDVEMPGMNGFETAKALRDAGCQAPVILLTSHREYAPEGYEVGAFRFLTKPLEKDKLHRALEAVENEKRDRGRLLVSQSGREFYLPLNEILYFKSENVYLDIQTEKGRFLVRKKLKEQLAELPETAFFQVHRSYIVNLEKIQSFDGKEVALADGRKINLVRGKRAAFQGEVIRYLKEGDQ